METAGVYHVGDPVSCQAFPQIGTPSFQACGSHVFAYKGLLYKCQRKGMVKYGMTIVEIIFF